jgi:hypothetical protein
MLREYLALLSNASPSGAAGSRGGVVLSLIFERAAVLCIGIDRYDACDCLAKAVSDAEEMESVFCEAYGEPQYEDRIEFPASAGLGHASIEEAMLAFAAELKERYSNQRELVAMYVAGHGMQQDGKVYLLPSDVSSDAPSASECIDVLKHVGAIQDARKAERSLLLVVDTCRSEHSREGDEASTFATQHRIPKGTLVCFAAPRGSEATDGGLLKVLLPRLCTPGTSVLEAVTEQSDEVKSVQFNHNFDNRIRLFDTLLLRVLRARQTWLAVLAVIFICLTKFAATPTLPMGIDERDFPDLPWKECTDRQKTIIQMCAEYNESQCELAPGMALPPILGGGSAKCQWCENDGCYMVSSPLNNCYDADLDHTTVYTVGGLCPSHKYRKHAYSYSDDFWIWMHEKLWQIIAGGNGELLGWGVVRFWGFRVHFSARRPVHSCPRARLSRRPATRALLQASPPLPTRLIRSSF